MSARNVHQEVTDRIIASLKSGVIPWKQPWTGKAFGVMPRNAVTGRAYSGSNILLLWIEAQNHGYENPAWLTYKQAQALGGNVKKGEKGTQIIYVSTFVKKDKATEEERRIGFLKTFVVFNVAQCENLPQTIDPQPTLLLADEQRHALADDYLVATGIKITHAGGRAFYARKEDAVTLPPFATFKTPGAYYGTAFHEITHATSHPTRCDRQLGKRFGDAEYSVEELIAELGSAFQMAEWGFESPADADPAAYIDHWIKVLESDEHILTTAASAASKAVEWLRAAALSDGSPVTDEGADEGPELAHAA